METRYKMLTKSQPEEAERLIKLAQEDVDKRWKIYAELDKEYTLAYSNGNKK